MAKRFKKSTEVQTVLFSRAKWTPARCREWLIDHGYRAPKVDTTKDYYRYRQHPPWNYQKGTFRTISLGRGGIKAVIAVPRATANPKTKTKRARIPALLVDIADAVSVDLENGKTLRFPASENWALCASKAGTELWIVSRRGSKRVAVTDDKGERLYETFTGFEHDETGRMVQRSPQTMKRVGRAMNIVYKSDKFGTVSKKYVHAFHAYPTVSVDKPNKPTIVAIRGGRIKIRQEGITG